MTDKLFGYPVVEFSLPFDDEGTSEKYYIHVTHYHADGYAELDEVIASFETVVDANEYAMCNAQIMEMVNAWGNIVYLNHDPNPKDVSDEKQDYDFYCY